VSRSLAKEKFARHLMWALLIFVGGFVLYWGWRSSYYGYFMPNTVYAKSGMSASFLGRGADYVMALLLTQLTPFLTIPAMASILRHRRLPIGIAVAAMAFAFYPYAILVGGDFMSFGRLVVPGWPFAGLLFGWLLQDIARSNRIRSAGVLAIGAAVMIVVIGLLPAFDVHIVSEDVRRSFHFRLNRPAADYRGEYPQWLFQKANASRWATAGRSLKRWIDPDARVVRGAIGAIGYYSNLFFYDVQGLVTREVAILGFEKARMGSPGHDRAVPVTFFENSRAEVMLPRLMSPQLGADRGLSAEETRRAFTDMIRGQWAGELQRLGWHNRYVVDFRPIPDWEYGGPGQYLVFWRRIDGDPGAAWRALAKRLEDYERGIDAYRSVVDEGYPQPPWRR